MRAIGQVLWLFNCWTFQVSFVICTDSFIRSTWASDSDLGRSWRPSGLSYVLGSGVSKIFVWMVVLCSVGASRRCNFTITVLDVGWCVHNIRPFDETRDATPFSTNLSHASRHVEAPRVEYCTLYFCARLKLENYLNCPLSPAQTDRRHMASTLSALAVASFDIFN